jgi:hypothetical protein
MRVAKIVVIAVAAMGVGAAMWTPATAGEPKTDKPDAVAPDQQKRLDLMRSKGPAASLTILPVQLVMPGKPLNQEAPGARDFRDRVTEVAGLLLE